MRGYVYQVYWRIFLFLACVGTIQGCADDNNFLGTPHEAFPPAFVVLADVSKLSVATSPNQFTKFNFVTNAVSETPCVRGSCVACTPDGLVSWKGKTDATGQLKLPVQTIESLRDAGSDTELILSCSCDDTLVQTYHKVNLATETDREISIGSVDFETTLPMQGAGIGIPDFKGWCEANYSESIEQEGLVLEDLVSMQKILWEEVNTQDSDSSRKLGVLKEFISACIATNQTGLLEGGEFYQQALKGKLTNVFELAKASSIASQIDPAEIENTFIEASNILFEIDKKVTQDFLPIADNFSNKRLAIEALLIQDDLEKWDRKAFHLLYDTYKEAREGNEKLNLVEVVAAMDEHLGKLDGYCFEGGCEDSFITKISNQVKEKHCDDLEFNECRENYRKQAQDVEENKKEVEKEEKVAQEKKKEEEKIVRDEKKDKEPPPLSPPPEPVVEEPKTILLPVLMVDWEDFIPANNPITKGELDENLNGEAGLAYYFHDVSGGKIDFAFDVFGWLGSDAPNSYLKSRDDYIVHAKKSKDDECKREDIFLDALRDAIAYHDADLDFYDGDNNKVMDGALLLYEGNDGLCAGAGQVDLSGTDLVREDDPNLARFVDQDVSLNLYHTLPEEGANAQTWAYQLGQLVLGVPDYSDPAFNLNGWCLSGGGDEENLVHPCAFEKWLFGNWIEPVVLSSTGTYTLDANEIPDGSSYDEGNYLYQIIIDGDPDHFLTIESHWFDTHANPNTETQWATSANESGVMIVEFNEDEVYRHYPNRRASKGKTLPAPETRSFIPGDVFNQCYKNLCVEVIPQTSPGAQVNVEIELTPR